jgi:hypothetical protein
MSRGKIWISKGTPYLPICDLLVPPELLLDASNSLYTNHGFNDRGLDALVHEGPFDLCVRAGFVAATLIVSPLAARLPYLSLEVSANPQFDGLTGLGTSRALSSRPRQAMTLESAMSLAPALPNDRPFRL